MLRVIIERPGASENLGVVAKISVGKNVLPDLWSVVLRVNYSITNASGYSNYDAGLSLTFYNDGLLIKRLSTAAIGTNNITYVNLYGDYNYDDVKILESFDHRVEIRNENGVLITDNGLPWLDGTYPPDAKNRAGLTGLHASPAVINPELETALMGDETDKERVQE